MRNARERASAAPATAPVAAAAAAPAAAAVAATAATFEEEDRRIRALMYELAPRKERTR